MSVTQKRAVFFLANDVVFEWAVAYLESVRAANVRADLWLIPFDENIDRLRTLQVRFGFRILESSHFAELERMGSMLEKGITPTGPHWFRKFAAFFETYEVFAYLDARTIVLDDLDAAFSAVESGRADLVYFSRDLNQVVSAGPARGDWVTHGRAFGMNSGRWVTRRELFTLEFMNECADFCRDHRTQMNPRNTDQFFLNTLCARSAARCVNYADLANDATHETWAREIPTIYRDVEVFRAWDHGGRDHRKRVPLLHWAGLRLSPVMPHYSIWFHFRHRSRSPATRLVLRLIGVVQTPALRLRASLRANRRLNLAWHRWRKTLGWN